MDIEGQFRKRKLLKSNYGVFDLSVCRWKSLSSAPSKKKQITNPPCKGYLHAASELKDTLYTVIGPDQQHSEQSMYSYNFKYHEWKQWNDCNLPASRDSFGLVTHQNELFLFGGSDLHSHFGDTHVFNNFTSSWRKLECEGPSPRNPMIFTDVNDLYIFLFGGVDILQERIFRDAFLFIGGTWRELELLNAPEGLVGATSTVCNEKVYIYGGETLRDPREHPVPNNKLYKLDIDSDNLTVEFLEVPLANGVHPYPRVSHSMLALNGENILMLGGIGIEGANKNKLMRDLWLFSTEECSWTQVDPMNGPLRGFCQSWLILHNHKVLILGGLADRLDTWNQQISALEFAEDETIRNEICTNCQQRNQLRDREEKSFPKTVHLSTGFFYNVSVEYRHPFQAIASLHQCAAFMGASSFRFSISKGVTENEVIDIEWDGNSMSREQFEHFVCHNSSNVEPEFKKFTTLLKIACFRLGKTLLLINANQKERKVFLLSSDSKVCPQFDEHYSFFAYVQNIQKGLVESHEGRNNKKIILNMLRSRLANPEFYLTRQQGTEVLIFEKNILVTSEQAYYYELINSGSEDITVYRSNKKIVFLQELGYHITREPEISLSNYASIMATQSLTPSFFVNNSELPVPSYDYLHKLKVLEEQGKITPVPMVSSSEDLEYDAVLYHAEDSDVIDDNLGILVYLEGKLINRFDYRFGDLFKEAFFKNRFKGATTIFPFLGTIDVRKGLVLNYLGTWFKRKRGYYTFLEDVRNMMKRVREENSERQSRGAREEPEQRKQSKVRM